MRRKFGQNLNKIKKTIKLFRQIWMTFRSHLGVIKMKNEEEVQTKFKQNLDNHQIIQTNLGGVLDTSKKI